MRHDARKDKSNWEPISIDSSKDNKTNNACNKRSKETDDDGIWCIGESDRAVDSRNCTRNELLSNTLESRNDLANDQTDTREDDVDATGKRHAGSKCPHNPVGLSFCANIQQGIEILELSRICAQDAATNRNTSDDDKQHHHSN